MADQKPGQTRQTAPTGTRPPHVVTNPITGAKETVPYGVSWITDPDTGAPVRTDDPGYVQRQQAKIAEGNKDGFLDKVGNALQDPMTYVDPIHAVTGLPTPTSLTVGAVKGGIQGYENTGTVGGVLGGAARGAVGSAVDDTKKFVGDVKAGATGTAPGGAPAPAGAGGAGATTTSALLSDPQATQALRDAIARGDTQYDALKAQNPAAAAAGTFKPVTSTDVAAQKAHAASYDPTHAAATGYTAGTAGTTLVPGASTISAPGPIDTALQRGVTAAGTTLDQSESEQSRAAQAQNLEDLRATAQGQGAGQIAAAARLKQALLRSGQQANGLVQQARGTERKGARLAAILGAGDQNLAAGIAERAQEGQEQQTAQTAVSQNLQQQRSTDVDVAAKSADLTQQRNLAQANLDQAKASGDQNAINAARLKLADLDEQQKQFNATQTQDVAKTNAAATNQGAQFNVTEADKAAAANAAGATDVSKTNAGLDTTALKDAADNSTQTSQFNAGQSNTVATGNAERGQKAQTETNEQGLAAESAGAQQSAQLQQLMLNASASAQQAANSILQEGDRNKQLALAQAQLAQAKSQADRSFWSGLISSLVTGGATLAGGLIGGPAGAVAAGTLANGLVSSQQNQGANNAIANTDQNYGGTNDVEPGLYAHGGLVTRPTLAIVGEAGPELILPVKGASARLRKALGPEGKPFSRARAPSLQEMTAILASAVVKARKEAVR